MEVGVCKNKGKGKGRKESEQRINNERTGKEEREIRKEVKGRVKRKWS